MLLMFVTQWHGQKNKAVFFKGRALTISNKQAVRDIQAKQDVCKKFQPLVFYTGSFKRHCKQMEYFLSWKSQISLNRDSMWHIQLGRYKVYILYHTKFTYFISWSIYDFSN